MLLKIAHTLVTLLLLFSVQQHTTHGVKEFVTPSERHFDLNYLKIGRIEKADFLDVFGKNLCLRNFFRRQGARAEGQKTIFCFHISAI